MKGQFCTFQVDGLLLGVEVGHVQEVMRLQRLTEVPLAPEVVGGLIHQRGQILTAIDLRRRLALPSRAGKTAAMNVVVRTKAGTVSLMVDEIGDVIEVEEENFEPVPDTLRGEARDLVKGAFKLEDRLLIVLDAERASQSEREDENGKG